MSTKSMLKLGCFMYLGHFKAKEEVIFLVFILTSITTLYHEWMNLIQQAFIIIVYGK